MTVAATDWAALNALPDADLKNALFDLLQQVAVQIQESDRDDPDVLSTVPRIATSFQAAQNSTALRRY
jgi:hypothetical protein